MNEENPSSVSLDDQQQQPQQDSFYSEIKELEKSIQSNKLSERKSTLSRINSLGKHELSIQESTTSDLEEKLKVLICLYFTSYSIGPDSEWIFSLIQSLKTLFKEISISTNKTIVSDELKINIVKFTLREIGRLAKLLPTNKRSKYVPQNTLISFSLVLLNYFIDQIQSNSDLTTLLFAAQELLYRELTLQQMKNNQPIFNQILTKNKILAFYQNIVTKDSSSKSFFIVYFLLRNFTAQLSKQQENTFKINDLLNIYNKAVIGSSQQKFEEHKYFKRLFNQLSNEDLQSIILPPLSRHIKRDQDQVFKILVFILENLSSDFNFIDLSSLLKSVLVPMLLPVIQSTTSIEENRKLLKKTFRLIIERSKDTKLISSMITDDLLKTLSVAGNPSQKLLIISVISSIISTTTFIDRLSSNEKLQLSKQILQSLSVYLEKELNKDNRIKGFKLLGKIMKMVEELPEQTIKIITNSLKSDDDIIKGQVILSLSKSLGPEANGANKKVTQIINGFTETVNTILKNVKNAKTCDPSTTISSLHYMLSLITTTGCTKNDILTKYSSDKTMISNLYASTSFLHTDGFIQRTTKKDHAIDLLLTLFLRVKSFPSIKLNDKSPLYSSVLSCLLHTQWSVSKHSSMKIRSILSSDSVESDYPLLSTQLLNEFSTVLFNDSLVALPTTTTQVSSLSNSSEVILTPTNKKNYSITFRSILSKHINSELYPMLTLITYHPFVNYNWKRVSSLIQNNANTTLASNAFEISQYLFEKGLNQKKNKSYQQAFQQAVNGLMNYNVPLLNEELVKLMVKALSYEPILAITQQQWSIYNTPSTELFVEKQEKVIESRNDRKVKPKTAEEQRDEEVRKRIEEKKKIQSGELEKQEKERQKQLAAQAVIRRDVQDIIDRLYLAMDTCHTMAHSSSSPEFVGEFMSPILVAFLQLMKYDLTNQRFTEIFEKLICCVPSRFKLDRSFARHYIYIINNIYYRPTLSEIQILGFIQKVLTHIKESASREPLSGFAFNYFWPIIKNGLETTISFTIQEISMDIIQKHTAQGQTYPRGSMISSLIIVVSTNSRLEAQARNTIFQLIEGVETSDIGELMEGIISPHSQVRSICLQAIEKIPSIYSPNFVWEDKYIGNLWFARFDNQDANTTALAEKIWLATNQPTQLPEDFMKLLTNSTFNSNSETRKINALAIKAAASSHTHMIPEIVDSLFETYEQHYPDEIKETPTTTKFRLSVASALSGLGNAIVEPSVLKSLFTKIIERGLFDPKEDVVQEFVSTGMSIINQQGIQFSGELLATFEAFLARPDNGTGEEDSIRANVIVYMGALAKHMDASNPKVSIVIDKLVDALSIPSESVQVGISKCIAQLIPAFKKQGDRLIPMLLEKLKNSGGNYADRRGAAFGLAGSVKGLGIGSLKNYSILDTLQSYIEDKKHPTSRQGALFAFECLCNTIGRVFEPYVIHILPKLLVCFGDNVGEVREATADTAKAIMSQLSGHGVKIVLPALLKALDDRSWRTKEGSIELLGAMAFCAPKQLSTCLPTIVPKLTYVLNDTHTKVQEAAKEALSHIGSVIRNPEIQIHVPLLLQTYDDPEIHSKELLENLLSTNYVHTIDPASLSLLLPILERTLKERSSELKKMSCQIVGNLCSLTEPKDLVPYLNILMPVMKTVLLDPIPEVRAICARALGLLVRGMGEENFSTLIPWLLETVKSDQGAVERSGAAQGLSEVLASLDISRFNSLINELLAMTNSPRSHVREGVLSIFIFTPISLGELFLPYLPKVLPQVLKGLADDSDPVREVCMRCGQSIVLQFAVSGIEVIVPALEKVLFNENWRIRLSCVQLFGDLLFKLAGTTAQEVQSNNASYSAKDDDEHESGASGNDIQKILGKERLGRILSSLYMMRFDNNSSVRQKVLLIWKYIVSNTPKTLREILPTLIEMIISSIGSNNIEKRQISAKTLGDIVSKLSDRILPEILPILERGLQSNLEETRQGVCIGLSEVISSAKTQLLPYLSSVVTCITKALCDPLIDVREAAAKAFDHLYHTFGSKASNEILPQLIHLLDNSNTDLSSYALDGLRQVILVRSTIVLPVLIPKLLSRPISTSNVSALSSLSADAGEGLYTHLSTIIPSLIESFTSPNVANAKEIRDSAISICKSIDEEGWDTLIPLLIEQTEIRLPNIRLGACELIGEFYNGNTAATEYPEELLLSLLSLFNDPDASVQQAANNALGFITKSLKKDNLTYLPVFQKGIQLLVNETYEEVSTIPGFCLPKGLASVLPPLISGLMYGTSDQREQATNTLRTVINHTSADALKPFVMQITGPLILVIGDKFPWQVKAAILQTLSLLISKSPASMKIFLHQLQPTFIKCLSDSHKNVRTNAASALGLLMTLSTSVDQLVNSLITGIGTADSISQESKLRALQSIFEKKPKVEQATLDKAIANIVDFLYQPSDDLRSMVAQTIGASSKCFASLTELNQFIKTNLISPSQSVLSRYGKSLALGEIFKASGKQLIDTQSPNMPTIIKIIQTDCRDEKGPIRESSAYLAEAILVASPLTYSKDLVPSICHLIGDQSSSVSISALQVIKRFCKANQQLSRQYLRDIVIPTMNRLKERTNLPLKLAAERTLVHSLQIFKESVVMDDLVKQLELSGESQMANSLIDYHKRVLIKLAPDSDIEK
ncbi:hypothetical protein RB653_004159 [Dictyostelium firmibasis]|uniref:TOG domain-containing protein n=1 Tax=Dictyostelium firmibasis TaxID=79012 RepID=A0AAN7YS52_9MYCE